MVKDENGEDIEVLKIKKSFNAFNKREIYPYEVIENPLKLEPY